MPEHRFGIQSTTPAGRPLLIPRNIDLLDFPSLVWFEPDYSVYTVRQASRRSWRIGQRQPVEVTFLVYARTLQADALGLIAAKVRSALSVEGELPEDGLAALEGDGQDVFLVLARRLTEHGAGAAESLEELFARTRQFQATADDFLTEVGWADRTISPSSVPSLLDLDGDSAATAGPPLGLDTTSQPPGPNQPSASSDRVVTFEDLARLIQRPRARRKAAPPGQIALFE